MVVRTSSRSHARLLATANPTRLKRLYAFAVGALAAFVAAFVLVHPPIKGYVAMAIIEYNPSSAKEGALTDLRRLATGLDVHPQDEGQRVFQLALTARDRREAVHSLEATIQNVASDAAVRSQAERAEALSLLADRLTTAQDAEQAARRAWEAAHQRQALQARAPSAETSPSRPLATRLKKPAALPVNPEWVELTQAVNQLRKERNELLVERLPAHPAVKDVEFRIATLEQRLAAIPGVAPTGPADATASSPGEQASPPANPAPRDARVKAEVALAIEAAECKRAWEAAKAELAAASAAHADTQRLQRQRGAAVRIIEEPAVHAVVGGRMPAGVMALLALVSIGVGFGLARGVANRDPNVLTTVDDVTRVLQLPVVAALPVGDHATRPLRNVKSRLATIGVRAAEATLFVVAALVLLAVASDSLVIHAAAKDPLQALALACERFRPF